jgi:hypothetical protein
MKQRLLGILDHGGVEEYSQFLLPRVRGDAMSADESGFRSVEPTSPTLDDIVGAYKRAVGADDAALRSQAELAVQRLATAEAAVAESATLVDFAARIKH